MVREVYYLALKAEEKLTRKLVVARGKIIAKGGKTAPSMGQSIGTKREVIEDNRRREEASTREITPDYQREGREIQG